jgi:Na+-transporting NADH:ubiquinone oxidoreductase subunit NqrD
VTPFNLRAYITYKLLNSLFLGLTVGVVFFVYRPLEPSIYSIGGVILALGMLLIAKQYHRILNPHSFYLISLSVEVLMLVLIISFLIYPYTYSTALLVYVGYQITFMFGNYLIRAETLYMKRSSILSFLDVAKQKGYLVGMLLSYLIYKGLEQYGVTKEDQVYDIHFIMIINEALIIYYLLKGFKKL